MDENLLILKNRNRTIIRLLFLIVPLLVLLLIFNKASFSIALGISFVALFYAFFKEHNWVLLVLAVPSLSFGQVINIPISASWVYEARLAEIFLLLSAAIYILDIFLNKKEEKLKIDSLSFLLAIHIILALISIIYIIDFRAFIFGLKIIAYSFLSYFLALNLLDDKRKILWFLYSISIGAVILSAQIFLKFYQMGFSSQFFFERHLISIPIGPIATTAAILAFLSPIILSFYFYLADIERNKPLVFVSFFFSFIAVFLTLGKGAIISLFMGLIFLFFKMKNKRMSFFLFFLWFMALVYLMFNQFFVGLFERFKITFIDKNTSFRITEYETGWILINNYLYTGVGAGQQLIHFKKMLNLEVGQQVNNFFLQSIIDFGILGLALMLSLFANVYFKVKKMFRTDNRNSVLVFGFVAAFICAFFNGMVEVTIYALPYAIVFWSVVGVFVNLEKVKLN